MACDYEAAVVDAIITGRQEVAHLIVEFMPSESQISRRNWAVLRELLIDEIVEMNTKYKEGVKDA